MTDQDSLLGKQIHEYRLESMLGQGGMARVYRGVDTTLRRYVAIKVIDSQFRSDSEYARRFELEAQAIAQFDHPNVVSLYRYGNEDGLLYMAMQYIEGSDLRRMLDGFQQDGEYMAPAEALRILREIGRGFDYIHKRGIVHRDVKPSNIMLDQDGTAIITDFGLALMLDVGTRGEIFGTPHYISPEQAVSSAKAVPQSDIYSLGVMVYEMFTNRLPFIDGEPLDIAMAHVTEEPPLPRSIRPELSKAVEEVILKALAKEPGERYQTCAELTDALEAALKHSEKATEKTTMPRYSILERVHLDMEAHPLPPIPAAVTPAKKAETPRQQDLSISERMAVTEEVHRPAETVKAAPHPDTATRVAAAPKTKTLPKRTAMSYAPHAIGGAIGALIIIIVLLLIMRGGNDTPPADTTGLESTTAAAQQNETLAVQNATAAVQQNETVVAENATISAQNATVAAQNAATEAQQVVITEPPTPIPTNLPTDTPAPTQTAIPTELPTDTPAPTLTPIPAQPATQVATLVGSVTQPQTVTVTLLIYTERDRSMRIANISPDVTSLALAPLLIIRADDDDRLRDSNTRNDPDSPRQLAGTAWVIPFLASGDCLDALKDNRQSAPADTVACVTTFYYETTGDQNKAWDKAFRVYYADEVVADCENGRVCTARITVSVQG